MREQEKEIKRERERERERISERERERERERVVRNMRHILKWQPFHPYQAHSLH